MQTFSAGSYVRYGWETFKKRPWFFALIFLALDVVSGVFTYRREYHQDIQFAAWMILPAVLFVIIGVAVRTLAEMGKINVLLKSHENVASVSWRDMWAPQQFWKFLLTYITYILIIIGGLILLIVPGVVWSIKYMFAPYLVMSRKLGVSDALRESARITYGKKWNLLWLGIVLALLNILGAICLLVGLLVTVPVSALAIVHAYRTLEQQASEPVVL